MSTSVERVGIYSILVNLFLLSLNLLMAALSGSLALAAETTQNLADLTSSGAVLAGLKLSQRRHRAFPYGLYKVENVVSLVIAFFIFFTAYEVAKEDPRGHLDELFIRIRGQRYYLWRAVDQDGQVLDILVQKRRNTGAAKRFFRKLLKGLRFVPNRLVTDKLRSYGAAHRVRMPSAQHCTTQYANNRAEVSHQPTRQRERHMRRFKSLRHVQRFLSVHSPINNLFRVGRHLMKAVHYRSFRDKAFTIWREVTTELAAA